MSRPDYNPNGVVKFGSCSQSGVAWNAAG